LDDGVTHNESASPGGDPVAYDDFDANGEKKLPDRLMERGAGKFGSYAGAAVGSALGYTFLGVQGGLLGAGIGAVVGEVFFEFFVSNLLTGTTTGPLVPRMIVPQMPKRSVGPRL
jgi:hypothetical protein